MGLQWYARYPGDYLRDTAHLTMLEHGAYTLLMDYYYSTAKPLPANAVTNAPTLALTSNPRLYRICRAVTPQEQEAVDMVIDDFFTLQGENYHHARIDTEIEKREDISDKRRKAREARENKAPKKKATIAGASVGANAGTIEDTTTTTTTLTKKKKTKISLNELSVEHIAEWLSKKRVSGIYTHIDEHRLLEMFKDYCASTGKTYRDYVAGYRNAFEWNNAPKKGTKNENNRHSNNKFNKSDQAKAAIMRGIE